jgi:hypothetical protein
MTTAPIIELADALVQALNDDAFSLPFTAQRRYLPQVDLEHADALHIFIAPRAIATSLATRTSTEDLYTLDIAVIRRAATDADPDALAGLVGEIADWTRFRGLPAMPGAVWSGVEVNPIFAPDHLKERRQFTSIISVTYRMRRGA